MTLIKTFKTFFLATILAALSSPLWAVGGSSSSLSGLQQPAFLPVEQAYQVDLELIERSDKTVTLAAHWQIQPGYYLYQKQFSVAADNALAKLTFAPGEELWDEFFQAQLVVYRNTTTVYAELPLSQLTDNTSLTLRSQGCADAGLCYPPREQWFAVDLERGLFTPLQQPRATRLESTTVAPLSLSLLLSMLLAAAVGGAILNLMPCVFPILSIKLLSLTQHANSRHPTWLHGLLYSAGVIVSFVAIAALMLALRSAGEAIGWGFQLQSPLFIAALAALFILMACNLFGLYQFSLGAPTATPAPTLSGAFANGVLATIVASPCTAPFMGSALGFAITQSSAVALLIFAALGAGMALPFLLLTLSPRLAAALPKPGVWMDQFKQLLGFPLLLTAVWLLWVFAGQTSIDQLALLLVALILLALTSWSWGLLQRQRSSAKIALLLISLLATGAATQQALHQQQQANWQAYSPALLEKLRLEQRQVLVNLTADWCVTCLVNERRALSGEEFSQLLDETQTVYIKGDWSEPDPEITALLNAHGRSGVPLYLLYRPGAAQAEFLPQLLSPAAVAEALKPK